MQVILSIAGSDSSAGAGIQQDLKTITALGNYGATVITAITAQNTLGVQHVMPVPAEVVARQIESVISDLDVRAVKIGMIPNLEVAQAIVSSLCTLQRKFEKFEKFEKLTPQTLQTSQTLQTFQTLQTSFPPLFPVVLDPVMISTSGTRLMAEDCVEYIVRELMPRCTLVTPNLPEMQMLDTLLHGQLPTNFLVKGGHAEGDDMTDRLMMTDGTVHTFTHPRIASKNLHGTGCTLSSAIASCLADGLSLPEAVAKAKQFLTSAIAAGRDLRIGHGNGPLKVQ